MANVTLTHDMLANRALFDLQNRLTFSRNVYTGYSSEYHAVGGYQKGDTVRIQLPNKYRGSDGATQVISETKERNTTVLLDTQKHVSWRFTAKELTLDIENFSKKHIVPGTIALANLCDVDGLAEYKNIYNQVGTPGTTPSTFAFLAEAEETMDNEAIETEPRHFVMSPKTKRTLRDGELKSVFNQPMVDQLIRKGFIGNYSGFEMHMDQNVSSHTVGAHGGTPLMNGATAEGATSLVTDGWTASTAILKKGDIFTVANVNAVNPISGQAWEGSQLRKFVVGADVSSDGSGNATITITPTIYSSAATATTFLPQQSIDTLPANGAAITVIGTASTAYPINMFFHPNAFAMTMVPFDAPASAGQSVMWGSATDEQLGLAISVSTAWDQAEYRESTRIDILYGWDTIEANYAVRGIG